MPPEKLGENLSSQIVIQATMNRAMPTPSCWAWFQGKNAASYTLSSASLLQMEEWKPRGTGFSGTTVVGKV